MGIGLPRTRLARHQVLRRGRRATAAPCCTPLSPPAAYLPIWWNQLSVKDLRCDRLRIFWREALTKAKIRTTALV